MLHRSTIIGILCGIWVYFGAEVEESAFKRMLTPDLYLFMASFLIFYRLLFKKIEKPDGDLDLHAMSVCFLGDFAWAVVAMFCTVPFLCCSLFPTERIIRNKRGPPSIPAV